MRSSWIGLIFCSLVIYYGVVHSISEPLMLLNPHALILVCGGTIAIAFLTYSPRRLLTVWNFIIFGFIFKKSKKDGQVVKDLITMIDCYYQRIPSFPIRERSHPFLIDAANLLADEDCSEEQLIRILLDRRNAVKRQYFEDAKILNNLAKYPPHLGLLGAASGMIEMMSALGTAETKVIGASMAVALTATLWGVGLNNFVFLPLADNSTKAAEDDLFLRDIIIETASQIKAKLPYEAVVMNCLNKLSMIERLDVASEYKQKNRMLKYVA